MHKKSILENFRLGAQNVHKKSILEIFGWEPKTFINPPFLYYSYGQFEKIEKKYETGTSEVDAISKAQEAHF